MQRVRAALRRALVPALALVSAFLLGAALIVLTDFEHLRTFGTDPIGAVGGAIGGVFEAYGAMVSGAIADPGRILAAIQSGDERDVAAAIRPMTETLVIATPFIFVALGLAVSFQAGLFNLGADGQFMLGSFGAFVAVALLRGQLPPALTLAVGLAGGALFGAAYGFLPGLLKARTGAHEVITTLMLNPIAPTATFLIASVIAATGAFDGAPPTMPEVPLLLDIRTIRLDWGLIAALATAAAVWFVLFRTTLGFELRANGFNPTAARGAGMSPGGSTMRAMALSGGLVGLGSAFFAFGPADGFGGAPGRDMGYVALALALLGGLRPTGVVLAAVLYGALDTGAKNMVVATGIPLALLTVVIALAVMFVAAPGLVRSTWRLGPVGPDERPSPTHGV